MKPALGIVWARRSDVRDALSPLWEDGTARVLQLTVEQAFVGELGPDFTGPLDEAAARGDLVAHSVMASPMTSPRDGVHHDWLRRTRATLARWPARWLTDHVGCSRADGWQAAPLPLPASSGLVAITRDHLAWVRDELEIPVGLEILALALSIDDVLWQPDLVDAIVRPLGGSVLLDLHNLWCQAVNFDLDPVAILERWPLDLVRELHVSGGSWADYPEGRFRRDTHDGPTPEEVFALIPEALARCPNAEVLTLERLRGTVDSPLPLRQEARRLAATLRGPTTRREARPMPMPALWREEPAEVVADALFRAARAGDRALIDEVAPGWVTDARGWRAAVELTAQWGQPAR